MNQITLSEISAMKDEAAVKIKEILDEFISKTAGKIKISDIEIKPKYTTMDISCGSFTISEAELIISLI